MRKSNENFNEEESFELSYHPEGNDVKSKDSLIEFLESSKKQSEIKCQNSLNSRLKINPVPNLRESKISLGNCEYE